MGPPSISKRSARLQPGALHQIAASVSQSSANPQTYIGSAERANRLGGVRRRSYLQARDEDELSFPRSKFRGETRRRISCELCDPTSSTRMYDLHDVVYGKVKVNTNCGSLPRAEANWTETCESMETFVAKLQLPRRPRAPPGPPPPDPGSESFSSEVSRCDSSRPVNAQESQSKAFRDT